MNALRSVQEPLGASNVSLDGAVVHGEDNELAARRHNRIDWAMGGSRSILANLLLRAPPTFC